ANVLAKLPVSQQPKAKRALQEIWMAETKAEAETAFDTFMESYEVKYEKAAQCLARDRDALLAFYDFPAEHWKHLRTTARSDRRAASPTRPRSPWCSSWSSPLKGAGAGSTVTPSCQS